MTLTLSLSDAERRLLASLLADYLRTARPADHNAASLLLAEDVLAKLRLVEGVSRR